MVLNLFLWLDYKAQRDADQRAHPNSDASGNEVGGIWDRLIGTFVSPSDTLAQWIMAIFTIAAVLLVWRTLAATRKMVNDTREIGDTQSRAWVSVQCRLEDQKIFGQDAECEIHFNAIATMKNHGRSPAIGVFFNAEVKNS